MIIRMSAGDLNAWIALVGFILGVGTGVIALKRGFSLGRAHLTNRMSGGVLPVLMLGILVLALATTLLKSSQSGPGSMHAPIILSSDRRADLRSVRTEVQNVLRGKYP